MVMFVGFTDREERLISGLVGRFKDASYQMGELRRIEKMEMSGYNGRVVPSPTGPGGRFESTMYLATCNPFTIAHELAHVSDIAVRHQETAHHMGGEMPTHWHLAHRMSSEYYANRIACEHVGEDDIFTAFKSDASGLIKAARTGDWADALIYHSLVLGIFHGTGRLGMEPRDVLPVGDLPDNVIHGMNSFKDHAPIFFAGYGEE